MKVNQVYSQDLPNQHGLERSPAPSATSSGNLLLLPVLLFQYQDFVIPGILMAIIIGILLLYSLIALVLKPLSRRTMRQAQQQRAAETKIRFANNVAPRAEAETQPTDQVVPKAEAETQPTNEVTPKTRVGIDTVPLPNSSPRKETTPTVLSMPTVLTVGEPSTLPSSGQRPANISWQIAGLTDVGLKRELNEDNMIMLEGEMDGLGPYGIYVVADGLGGHKAGEVASRLTVEAVQKQHTLNPPTAAAAPFEEWLTNTIMLANESVLKHQEENVETSKMGSTVVMALVAGENVHISNVGDSRAYWLNDKRIKQISVDHSLVERLVQIGQITREEARTHKQRNVIYSIVGEKRKLEIGFYHVDLHPGDRLLLCSDGLSGLVTDEQLHHISKHQPNPAKASQIMIETAKQAGGHDNITAIIVQMNGS
jgi:protein phosphatase